MTMLETRVRELEHIVHGFLRDRINQEEADVWHELAGGQTNTFTPSTAAIEGRGHRIADQLDRWPEAQKWKPRS
jgi:hypothetical protein